MAYNVSEDYRDVVYSGEALYDCHLYIGEDLISPEQIRTIKISSPIIDTSDETGEMFHIGTFISQKLEITFKNLDGLNLSNNPEIQLEIGTMINNSYEYVPIGKYIIDDLGENYQETCEITCLDYAIKFRSELDISQFFNGQGYIYASDLFEAICGYYGVSVGTYPGVNNDKIISTYDSSITGKQYIMYLAELFGGNAKIERDGSCSIIPLKNYTNIEIDGLSSKSFKVGDTYELTRVCYDDGRIKLQAGGNVITVNTLPSQNISLTSYYYLTTDMKYYQYVNNEWTVTTAMKNTLFLRTDNFFIRQQAEVDAIYNAVKNFSVTNIECENRMDLSLDCWDIVKYTVGNNYYYTLYDNTTTYNGVAMGTVAVKIPLKISEETTNVIEASTQSQIRNLRTTVNEQDLSIETIIYETVDNTNPDSLSYKQSKLTERVDVLESTISDVMDFTTSGETGYARLDLQGISESNPITIRVHPILDSISYLYPHLNLFPSSNTFLKVRKIRFTNLLSYVETSDTKYKSYKKYYSYDNVDDEYTLMVAGVDYTVGNAITETVYENEKFDYDLPDDLLYYNSETYDEFYLDYNSETCQVTKKCKYNADGTVGLLAQETINTYPYPDIYLSSGDYTIELVGYTNGYLFVRALTASPYTMQFTTKAELSSKISQTVEEIDLSVDQKLYSYSTTAEMNAAITLKANEITSTVSETYETKGNAQRNYSRLTQTANSIQTQVSTNSGNISTLQQTATNLTSTVSQKVGKTEIISRINQSAEAITINANKIGLSANDVINIIAGNTLNLTSKNIAISSTYFSVDKNGNITATGGTIGGFTIKSTYLANGTTSLGGASNSVYLGTDGISCGTNFKVTKAGALTCSGATISGQVTATTGTIGGFTLGTTKLYNGKSSLTANSNGVYIGTDGISLGTGSTFKVTSSGQLTATNANISGTITATSGSFNNITVNGATITSATITESCSVPASTVSGTLSTSTIPEMSAAKITSGTMNASRINGGTLSGVNISAGTIYGSGSVTAGGDVVAGGYIEVNSNYGCYMFKDSTGEYSGESTNVMILSGLDVDSSGRVVSQAWKRLRFKGGILVAVQNA